MRARRLRISALAALRASSALSARSPCAARPDGHRVRAVTVSPGARSWKETGFAYGPAGRQMELGGAVRRTSEHVGHEHGDLRGGTDFQLIGYVGLSDEPVGRVGGEAEGLALVGGLGEGDRHRCDSVGAHGERTGRAAGQLGAGGLAFLITDRDAVAAGAASPWTVADTRSVRSMAVDRNSRSELAALKVAGWWSISRRTRRGVGFLSSPRRPRCCPGSCRLSGRTPRRR
jgi:hypothetical protein